MKDVKVTVAGQECTPGPEEIKVDRPATPPPGMRPVDPGARFKAPKGKHGLPLNIPLRLDDGRLLLVRRGNGQTMVCRQIGKKDEKPAILREGDTVATVAGRDGRKAVLHVEKRTRKDVHFRILGSVDGTRKSVGPAEAKTAKTPQEPGSGPVAALPGTAAGEHHG